MARKKRRSNGFIDILNGLLSLVVIGIVIAGGVAFFGIQQFYASGPADNDTTFFVEQGNGLNTIAGRLAEQNLIGNEWIFRAGIYATSRNANVLPGEYAIPAHASAADILRILTTESPIPHFITVPEGWTAWEVVQELNASRLALVGDVAAVPPEGSVLPGRYDFLPNSTRQTVLDEMQAAMSATVAQVWAECDPTVCGEQGVLKTPEELVILASVVEKETGIASERPEVAAVFVNRLRVGMRLQSDPTIIYGITMGQGKLNRGIRRSEIEAQTPYNTYQIDRLPPTPIANPGIDALRAVAHPDTHKYLYFVAKGASPSDGHLFAESYADHQKNVALYRAAVRASEAEAEAEAAREALAAEEAAQAGDATGTP